MLEIPVVAVYLGQLEGWEVSKTWTQSTGDEGSEAE